MKWSRITLALCLFTSTSALALAAYSTFRDVPEGAWYADSVERLASIGILQGNPDGTYRPSRAVNRAELAVMMDRLLEYIETGEVSQNPLKSLELEVPFTSQAPSGKWALPFKEACEEASLIMVNAFLIGKDLVPADVEKEILGLVDWEGENGYGIDVGVQDIATIAREYYNLEAAVFFDENVTVKGIKAQLESGFPVIVPAAGLILANPNYTGDGPPYHMIVLVGYNRNGFLAHDPGASAGASYEYTYETVMNAIHDWTGSKDTVESGRKAMVVLRKPE